MAFWNFCSGGCVNVLGCRSAACLMVIFLLSSRGVIVFFIFW